MLFTVLLTLFLLSSPTKAASYGYDHYTSSLRERILNFDVTAIINEDASLTVREDLEFVAAGINITHGLVRAIPVRYTSENGRSVSVGLQVLSTSIDGKELPWKESNKGRGRYIRIGTFNSILSTGTHTLTLVYKTTKQLGFYDDYDELYWNVTGNDWDMPIQNASFSLSLLGREPGEGFDAVEWYTGKYGSTATDGAQVDDTNMVSTTRTLQPGEGLTVVYIWPKGIIAQPETPLKERLIDWIYGHAQIVSNTLLAFGAALGAIFISIAYFCSTKKSTYTVVPLFHAPESMTASKARYVTNGVTDVKSLSAELIAMAIAGFLKIHGNKNDGYKLEKCQITPVSEPHSRISEIVFSKNNSINISQDNSEIFREAKEYLDAETELSSGILTKDRRGILRIAYIFMLIAAGASAFFGLVTEALSSESVFASILLAFLSLVCIFNLLKKDIKKERGALKSFIAAVGPLLPFLAFLLVTKAAFECPVQCAAYTILALLGLPLRKKLLHWTEGGAKLRSQAEGLEMFIMAAEKDRLEMLNPPDDTPALFEELLPYAVALDCAKTWANRFEKTLALANYQPTWCDVPVASGGMMLGARGAGIFAGMTDNLAKGFSSNLASASTPPGSRSGYSGAHSGMGGLGGGCSGGGGGGGGGHGW